MSRYIIGSVLQTKRLWYVHPKVTNTLVLLGHQIEEEKEEGHADVGVGIHHHILNTVQCQARFRAPVMIDPGQELT